MSEINIVYFISYIDKHSLNNYIDNIYLFVYYIKFVSKA